jgi:predicted nucleic acid-binding protein
MSTDEALRAFDETMNIPVELRNIEINNALQIACREKIYAYDAYFLECALLLRCPILSLDGRMRDIAASLRINIIEVRR